MIKPEIYYTLICDRCKELFEANGINGYTDDGSVLENAMDPTGSSTRANTTARNATTWMKRRTSLFPYPIFHGLSLRSKTF